MDLVYYLSLTTTAVIASTSTFALHNKYAKISPILASASLTLCIAIICKCISDYSYLPVAEIPYVFIGSSFIGMSTRKKAKTYLNIILASFFFCLIYFKSSQFFQGYGGALGLSACISILIVITSSKLFIRSKHIMKKRRRQKEFRKI